MASRGNCAFVVKQNPGSGNYMSHEVSKSSQSSLPVATHWWNLSWWLQQHTPHECSEMHSVEPLFTSKNDVAGSWSSLKQDEKLNHWRERKKERKKEKKKERKKERKNGFIAN